MAPRARGPSGLRAGLAQRPRVHFAAVELQSGDRGGRVMLLTYESRGKIAFVEDQAAMAAEGLDFPSTPSAPAGRRQIHQTERT